MQGMATKIMALFSFVSKSVQDFLDRPITLKKSKWNDRKKIYELTSFILLFPLQFMSLYSKMQRRPSLPWQEQYT